jgi:hypothetical protein
MSNWMDYHNALTKRNDFARRAGAGYDAAGRMTFSGTGFLGASPTAVDKTRDELAKHESDLVEEQNKLAQANMLEAQRQSQWQAAHERNLQAAEQTRRNQETMGQQENERQKYNVLSGLLSRAMPGAAATTTVRNW